MTLPVTSDGKRAEEVVSFEQLIRRSAELEARLNDTQAEVARLEKFSACPELRRIFPADLQRLFDLPTLKSARALIKQMGHVTHGRTIWTKAEWVAEWEARQSLEKIPHPDLTSPRQVLIQTAATVVAELVGRGLLQLTVPHGTNSQLTS